MFRNREVNLHDCKSWNEARDVFIESFNRALRESRGGHVDRLDVIHGYGSSGEGGVIRDRLRAFLSRNVEHLEFVPGEDEAGNPGRTYVTPVKALPTAFEQLTERVWEYCAVAKPLAKVKSRFWRDELRAERAVEELERTGRIRVIRRGRVKLYESVN
jgi:hypothetical protein